MPSAHPSSSGRVYNKGNKVVRGKQRDAALRGMIFGAQGCAWVLGKFRDAGLSFDFLSFGEIFGVLVG